jgi:hypothetical protein
VAGYLGRRSTRRRDGGGTTWSTLGWSREAPQLSQKVLFAGVA